MRPVNQHYSMQSLAAVDESAQGWSQQRPTAPQPQVLWTSLARDGLGPAPASLAFTCQPKRPTASSTAGSAVMMIGKDGQRFELFGRQVEPSGKLHHFAGTVLDKAPMSSSSPSRTSKNETASAIMTSASGTDIPSTALEPVEKYSEGGLVAIGRKGSAIFSANNSQWMGPLPTTDTRESKETITTSPLARGATRPPQDSKSSTALISLPPSRVTPRQTQKSTATARTMTPLASLSSSPVAARWFRRPDQDYGVLTVERMEKNERRRYQIKVPVAGTQMDKPTQKRRNTPGVSRASPNEPFFGLFGWLKALAGILFTIGTVLISKVLVPRTDRNIEQN
jgi:hypothetical protein